MSSNDENGASNKSAAKRTYPICPACGRRFKYRLKRSWLMRTLVFWKPLKRYYCAYCKCNRYISKPNYIVSGIMLSFLFSYYQSVNLYL